MRAPEKAAPFDLDAARAARAEVRGEPFDFVHYGQPYTMPSPRDWPIQVTDRMSQGDLRAALRMLLGEDKCDEFLAAGPVTMGDIEALFEAVAKWSGLGNLPN